MRWKDDGLAFSLPGLPPIWVHASAPLVALLLTLPLWTHGVNGRWTAALVAPAIMLSVLAHELGHALMARRLGLIPTQIRLHASGGEAVIGGWAWSRAIERRIILAGPLVNLLLGGTCLALAWLLMQVFVAAPNVPSEAIFTRPPPLPPPVVPRALYWIGGINIGLAVVNMLPAYPLDGGRLLHSLIEERWSQRRAQFWIGLCGLVLAVFTKLVFLGSLIAGMPIWSPPDIPPNWEALQAARQWRSMEGPKA
ncbi:hypothetical protein GXW71_02095 [Roseomonas hellenica]|uniref:Peptidase M50 domain-containing protein n=1 Tax=Plastoroseomonas hellenica TaxID=2687306 RepID=A0ABS5ES60_9PROT|nr:M50 family metallopeptidase [Plastoroseomonas hellenica]MBR0663137.1 hypothetical protein [Plastoroseomonas hellenica]